MSKIIIALIIISTIFSCQGQTQKNMPDKHEFTNDLINETSPYLLQHAHNPVDWYAWNDETLELAKKENKLILISIGYSTCHWCHVMEHESFEDSTVASIMNEHFINIKIDREERPDVDQVYQKAVQLITGRAGGWPLNCIALPDQRPFWGGTYFPKENWVKAITQLAELYEKDPQKIEEVATKLTEGIQQSDLVQLNTEEVSFTKVELDSAVTNWQSYLDLKNGGRSGAPKFPMSNNLQYLLRYAVQNDDSNLLEYVNTSLTKMAYGGIFDQIGGGFSRYSTDEKWHIPHFEKMLYDNAQLINLYSNAYLVYKEPLFKNIVYETIQFVERELYNDIGAFYTALDADSMTESGELEEGAYYVWTKEELERILNDDFEMFSNYFNVNSFGKWEKDNYHLIRNLSNKEFSEKYDISIAELTKKVDHWQEVLLKVREKRSSPRLDDKALTSQNALMLKAYIGSYTVFDDDHFLKMALKSAQFISNHQFKEGGGLFRNYKDGKSNINAYLEDYAIVIDAFISLYEATFDENWLKTAKQLTDYTFEHFYDEQSKMFFFSSDENQDLITRKIEIEDNVIPSSNSIMALNLFKLGHYFENKNYSTNAKTMLNNVKENVVYYGGGYSNWLMLYNNYIGDFYEIAIVGSDAKKRLKELSKNFIPNKIIIGSLTDSDLPLLEYKYSENETTIYVCIDGACKLPVNETNAALKQINIKY